MGWSSSDSWRTWQDVTEAILNEEFTPGSVAETHTVRQGPRGEYWTLSGPPDDLRIDVFLVERHRERLAYKPISEAMGPSAASVPLAWFDRAPVRNADWRAQVRASQTPALPRGCEVVTVPTRRAP